MYENLRPLQFLLVNLIKPQINTDFQAAYRRSSAVILIISTCSVTVSERELTYVRKGINLYANVQSNFIPQYGGGLK